MAMILVFVSMLPAVPVRAYVSSWWQHLLVKGEWAFIIACTILFVPYTNPTDFLDYFGIVVAAPLAGLLVSVTLTRLFLGKLPEARNPPTDRRFVDPLFDWSREAVAYKIKRLAVPYACGIVIAMIMYQLLT